MKYKKMYFFIFVIFLFFIFKTKSTTEEKTLKIQKENFQEKIIISGVIKSPEILTVSSEVSGKIIQLLKKEGDYVSKGELLLKIDNNQIKLKLLQENENLKSALSELTKLQTSDLSIAKSNLETATSNFKISENEYYKFKKLFENNLITEIDFNSKKLRYLSDKDSYIQSKNIFESISVGEDKNLLLIKIKNIELAIQGFEDEISKYIILSPTDGVITETSIEIGEIVSQHESLFEISSGNTKILEIDLDEKQISKVEINQQLETFFINNSNTKSYGKIFYLSPYVNKNNGTVKIKSTIENQSSNFLYNMNINAIIYGKKYSNIILIPQNFLYFKDDEIFVYKKTLEKNKLHKVNTALIFSEKVVISEGLQEGDEIIYPTDKIRKQLEFNHY
ncbi:MAG: efflux RND transporter periplasmic adaptor subunit [Fusobacteriaceae bacterium]